MPPFTLPPPFPLTSPQPLSPVPQAEGSLKERFERPSATTLAVATLQARQAEYVAASQPLVLGAETRALLDRRGDALRADVGPWRGCALFEMTGAKVRVVLKRNSRLCALRDDVQAAVDGAPADAADAAAAAAKGGGDGVHGGGSGDGEADDEVVAVARRVLSAESSLRPVKEALRALLAQPDPLTAGRALQDEARAPHRTAPCRTGPHRTALRRAPDRTAPALPPATAQIRDPASHPHPATPKRLFRTFSTTRSRRASS